MSFSTGETVRPSRSSIKSGETVSDMTTLIGHCYSVIVTAVPTGT